MRSKHGATDHHHDASVLFDFDVKPDCVVTDFVQHTCRDWLTAVAAPGADVAVEALGQALATAVATHTSAAADKLRDPG